MLRSETGRVLLVDDNAAVLRSYESVLQRQGWTVDVARDGLEARVLVQNHAFDVIISDINMPGNDGLSFLRSVRERDLDVPVILVTGQPSVASSIRAIEYGVFRYLVKPVANEALAEVVSRAARLHKLARLKREALQLAGADGTWLADRAALENRFAHATASMWMAFQPIVAWRSRQVYGYEALLRCEEPTLVDPLHFVQAAERLDRLHDLGRAVRASVARAARELPTEAKLFLNLHAADLDDDDLRDSLAPLSANAARVILEVTERASLEKVKNLPLRVQALKQMGFRIAIDDLGAGHAGLSSFAQLEPEVVKLDTSLVRDIDENLRKQAIVQSMTKLCDSLDMIVVAEGVETRAERDTLVILGCDLLQGYLFARPARGFPSGITWSEDDPDSRTG